MNKKQTTPTPVENKTIPKTKVKSFTDRYNECIANLSKVPTVSIKGKQYSTVAERHRHLKKYFPESRIIEEVLFHDIDRVIVKTSIYIGETLFAVGHAEEKRNSSFINKTSALENCSSSSLGRCLAAFGLSGSEYASAEELVNALNNQNGDQNTSQKINKITTKTKLNAFYNDYMKEHENIIKAFNNKEKDITNNGGQNVSNW